MLKSASILNVVRWLLIGTALTPLLVSNRTIFPFVFPKIVYFRVLVEIAVFLCAVVMIAYWRDKSMQELRARFFRILANPLFIAISLFFVSLFISAFFAPNTYRAFWGDIERGEGIFGILHAYAFLILAAALFEKKNWARYFQISLIAGAILIVYAFFEYFGWRFLLFAPPRKPRPEALIGNPAFLATHLIFVGMFAALYYYVAERKTFLTKCFVLAVAVLSTLTIFFTGTRGAILGIGAGLVIFLIYVALNNRITARLPLHFYRVSIRVVALAFLAFGIIFAGVFWQTHTAAFWQSIPGLNRLARTASLDVNDPSTQFRIITWRVSWNAFKERPFFGWGPENYLVANEKYYDPTYPLYGEAWLDRAHNKIFDVLVTQGIFGLAIYLGIFAVLVRLLWGWSRRSPVNSHTTGLPPQLLQTGISDVGVNEFLPAIVLAGVVAYFVQNLVLFDQIVSNATLFALFSFLIFTLPASHHALERFRIGEPRRTYTTAISKTFLVALGILAFYSVFEYNVIPYAQAVRFKASPTVSQNAHTVELAIKQAMYPYNFAQFNIRAKSIDEIYSSQYFGNQKYVSDVRFRPIGRTLIDAIQELVDREPYDVRNHIRLTEMLNDFARGMNDAEIVESGAFERAELLMREALTRAPRRQELYYHLAFNLAAQKKYDEAERVARQAIDLEPRLARAHYHLALVLALTGKNEETLAALAKTEELSPNLERFMPTDLDNILIFYKTLGRPEKFASLVQRTLLPDGHPDKLGYVFSRAHYEDAFRYYLIAKDAERAIMIANYLQEQFLDLREDMLVLIDLLQKRKWDIIDSLE